MLDFDLRLEEEYFDGDPPGYPGIPILRMRHSHRGELE